MNKHAEAPADRNSNATKMGAWPFEGQEVSRKSAVAYVADIVWPDLNKSVARKRVRERVRDASRKGLALTYKDDVVYPAFWFWAGDEWSDLRRVRGYPTKPPRKNLAQGDMRASVHVLDFVIPSDLARAQEELQGCQRNAGRLNRALLRALAQRRRLKSALKIATDALAHMEAAEEDESRNRSAAGKKAAGVPKRRF